LLYVSLSFGFSLAVNCWVFYRISGGLFNPAVSENLLEGCSSYFLICYVLGNTGMVRRVQILTDFGAYLYRSRLRCAL
jgi:hypothetical protein